MSILSNLKRSDKVEAPKDTLGGGFSVLASDVYDAQVVMAYLGTSSGGAAFIDFEFKLANDSTHKERVYVSSGDAKGNSNQYERKGKMYYLPGFIVADDIAAVTTGHLLADQDVEDKDVKIYDFDAKAEVPKEVPVLTGLLGKQLKLGIRKVIEYKRKEVSPKVWKTIDETREFNEIDKVFNEDGFTVLELLDGAEETDFLEQWVERNKGKDKDLTKNKKPEVTGTGGSGVGSPAAPKKSLFPKK